MVHSSLQQSSNSLQSNGPSTIFPHPPITPSPMTSSDCHVQTIKAALTKAQQAKADPDLALLCLCTMPISSNLLSPMEILTGKRPHQTSPQSWPAHCQRTSARSYGSVSWPRRWSTHQRPSTPCQWTACTLAGPSDWGVDGSNSPEEVRCPRDNCWDRTGSTSMMAPSLQPPTHHPPVTHASKKPAPGPKQPLTEPAQQQSKQANAPYTTLSGRPSKPPSQTCDSDDRTLQVVE